jgi:hypothetical protein
MTVQEGRVLKIKRVIEEYLLNIPSRIALKHGSYEFTVILNSTQGSHLNSILHYIFQRLTLCGVINASVPNPAVERRSTGVGTLLSHVQTQMTNVLRLSKGKEVTNLVTCS